MELTQQILSRFVGAQLEIQSPKEDFIFRGQIGEIKLTGRSDAQQLTIMFDWLARMTDDSEWEVVAEPGPYSISMMIYEVTFIGGERLHFSSSILGENATMFPLDGSTLDPTTVKGLVLA